jgi:hypothetical protein
MTLSGSWIFVPLQESKIPDTAVRNKPGEDNAGPIQTVPREKNPAAGHSFLESKSTCTGITPAMSEKNGAVIMQGLPHHFLSIEHPAEYFAVVILGVKYLTQRLAIEFYTIQKFAVSFERTDLHIDTIG